MDAVTIPLEDLDAVVEAFAGAVGPIVFPAVLDIGAVVSDGACAAPGSVMVRLGISTEPFGKGVALKGIDGHGQDFMEILECAVSLPEAPGEGEGGFQQFRLFCEGIAPVIPAVERRSGEEPCGAF